MARLIWLSLLLTAPALAGEAGEKERPVRPEFILEGFAPVDDDSEDEQEAQEGGSEDLEEGALGEPAPTDAPPRQAPSPTPGGAQPRSSEDDPFQAIPGYAEPAPKPRTNPPEPSVPKFREPDPGLATWGVFPVQMCAGWAAGLFMCPVSLATFGLGGCCAPAAISVVEVIAGDATGLERGSFLWPTVSAYCAGAVCSSPFLGVWAALGGLALYASQARDRDLAVGTLAAGAWSAALIPVALVSTLGGMTLAPAVTYHVFSEPKRIDDPDFRLPGFRKPAHKARDVEQLALPIPATTAMRY